MKVYCTLAVKGGSTNQTIFNSVHWVNITKQRSQGKPFHKKRYNMQIQVHCEEHSSYR